MKTKELTPELYRAILAIVDERVKEIKVTREDFNRLEGVVERLGKGIEKLNQAQRRAEKRMDRIEAVVGELAEAQKRTEQRVEELAEAQKRTEQRVEELAEAQRRTEGRVEELAQAQKRTEERVGRLETAMSELAQEHAETQRVLRNLSIQVGRLSDTVGYGLEDVALVMLPPYLEKHYGIKIEDPKKRFLEVNGEKIEINLYAEGKKNGRKIVVIGEIKSRIYEREVKKFTELVKKVSPAIEGEILKVMFGYLIHPDAEELAKKEGILLVASYMR